MGWDGSSMLSIEDRGCALATPRSQPGSMSLLNAHGCAPLRAADMEVKDVNQAGRGRDRTLARVQGTAHHALAQPPGGTVLAIGQVQRRADLAAPPRRGRSRRPDLGRRLRPD